MSELSLAQILRLEEIEPQAEAEVEAEIQHDDTVTLMQTPPGPLKANCVGRNRPRSGPFEDDGESG